MTQGNELQGRDLQLLAENIPGGVFSCRYDEPLTLLQVNDGFLAMLGYTRQDLHERFHDSFWNMIDPRDRAPTLALVRRQMALGPDKEIEYRMLCRDGRIIWVLDKGHLMEDAQGPYFCCVLVDITRSKELEAKLRLSLDRHRIVLDQMTDVLFEWDLVADTFEFSANWEKKFGSVPVTRNISLYLHHAPHVYHEDQAVFAGLLERIRRGEHYAEAELRFLDAAGDDLWCRVRMTGQTDESGRTVRAVGVILDIDAEKRRAQNLMERAQQDALTKLYNKGACQELVSEALRGAPPDSCSALLLIDLDNFKQANDTRGHLFGDALLMEVAHTLQSQFRARDIVARVGGDEFLVFLPRIPDQELALRKARQVLEAVSGLTAREHLPAALSCSIGIALSPACGTAYQQLFQRADEALYRAKGLGKNQAYLYDPAQAPAAPTAAPRSAVTARIDSDEMAAASDGHLMEHVFRTLYRAADLDTAVNSILALAGAQFDVSRAYIFEEDEDGAGCSNTFEWCGEGIEPQIGNLQHVSYEKDLGGCYQENFNEEGVFYCRDVTTLDRHQYAILKPQGIKSMLQCAIHDGGTFRGFVGFDECRVNRFWTQEQVDALTFIAELLSTFLLKHRAQQRAVENARAMESLLDGQAAWIYAVRPGTFELLYLNRSTRELVPTAAPGTPCYSAFFQRTSPCEFCPVQQLEAGGTRRAYQIYNPVFRVWTSTDASRIRWHGADAYLLACHDITDLKEGPLER